MARRDETDDAPTPPQGVPAIKDGAASRKATVPRRVAAAPVVDRHERLLTELVERVEARMNRRSRGA